MAGSFTRGVTIGSAELLTALGPKLAQLADLSTISGIDDTNSGTTINILQVQASAPTGALNDFWSDTTTDRLRVYTGTTNRWDAPGIGIAYLNSTGAIRAVGDVVGVATATGLAYDGDSDNQSLGIVMESTADAARGLVGHCGIATINVASVCSRGVFLRRNTVANSYSAISGGDSRDFSVGISLQSTASGPVQAILYPYVTSTGA